MKLSQPQYISDNAGKKISVVLSMKEYERILKELEESEDIRDYDEVKAKNEKGISLEKYIKLRKNKHILYN